MNVGVVTPYDSNNFGAFLQAWALKRHLEGEGHTVTHVRFRSDSDARHLFYRSRPCVRDLLNVRGYVEARSFGKEKHRLFRRDSACFREVEPLRVDELDAVVLGSDEIWNIRQRAFRNPIFFGHRLNRVIAYATSIGASTYDDYADYPERLADLLRLRAIMVRDANTMAFVEKVTSSRPPIVVDPTLLYRWDSSPQSACDEYVASNRYLLVYAYGSASIPVERVKCLAQARGLKTVAVGFRQDWCDHSVNCSPLEFIDVVDRADCVFTTTFHGTIFAILRNKSFVSRPTSPKTHDLLHKLGLTNRLLEHRDCSDVDLGAMMEGPADYTAAFDIVDRERQTSRDLLNEALGLASGRA